jgi:excisionase family DNA binding protein
MNLITINQASEFLNLKTSRLRYLVFRRKIPFVKIGASVLFDKPDLQRWLENKKVGVAHE